MKGGKTLSVHKNNCKMAPFREQFYDLVTGSAPLSHRKRSLRHISTAKLFKYSAFDNPNIPSFDTSTPRFADHPDEGDEEVMDESEDPEIKHPDSPDSYPDLGYRERGQFPSDPDESSMEEGEYLLPAIKNQSPNPRMSPEEPDPKYQLDTPLQNGNSPLDITTAE